eukprot:g29200.t1
MTLIQQHWNVLPEEVVEADTIVAFKKHLIQLLQSQLSEFRGFIFPCHNTIHAGTVCHTVGELLCEVPPFQRNGRLVQKVKSCGIRGSELGPLLFVVCINDLEENVAGLISKFADDTKIGGVAESEDCQRLQQDTDQLETWAEKWRMELNLDK